MRTRCGLLFRLGSGSRGMEHAFVQLLEELIADPMPTMSSRILAKGSLCSLDVKTSETVASSRARDEQYVQPINTFEQHEPSVPLG